ncbi:Gti1/Pac2 family-domain-containing protein [Dipodascopsis tothii]|uniref:Gti1/Pac2 family-domain-containing protein n=1 Tax=Dipodascopsis tothii TaxID=44089 RepID=UPI0034CD3F4E
MPDQEVVSATYTGYVSTTQDALILFQACTQGLLNYVVRRPHDRERADLIRSGNIFIFSEHRSGIKRWTDGIAWSPSRILGNFLVYRQLEKPFAPGEKKRAAKRSRRKKRLSAAVDPYQAPAGGAAGGPPYPLDQDGGLLAPGRDRPAAVSAGGMVNPEAERALVGSLVDSYGFKDGGLIKKTMSVNIEGVPHHLVSYYRPEDVLHGSFSTPSTNPVLRDLPISPELTQRQHFRIPPDGSGAAADSAAAGAAVTGLMTQGMGMYGGGVDEADPAAGQAAPAAGHAGDDQQHANVIGMNVPEEVYDGRQYVSSSFRQYPGAGGVAAAPVPMPVYGQQAYGYMPQSGQAHAGAAGAAGDQKYYPSAAGDFQHQAGHAPYGWNGYDGRRQQPAQSSPQQAAAQGPAGAGLQGQGGQQHGGQAGGQAAAGHGQPAAGGGSGQHYPDYQSQQYHHLPGADSMYSRNAPPQPGSQGAAGWQEQPRHVPYGAQGAAAAPVMYRGGQQQAAAGQQQAGVPQQAGGLPPFGHVAAADWWSQHEHGEDPRAASGDYKNYNRT